MKEVIRRIVNIMKWWKVDYLKLVRVVILVVDSGVWYIIYGELKGFVGSRVCVCVFLRILFELGAVFCIYLVFFVDVIGCK